MLYIKRDADGTITSIYQGQPQEGAEPVSLIDPEIISFLKNSNDSDSLANTLSLSDSGLVRVVEDLIDVLIRKQVILLTDLPQAAQEKIRARKQVREQMNANGLMVDDII